MFQIAIFTRKVHWRGELYLRFDSLGTENRDFTGENVFHGLIVDFTGFAQKQPISRARDVTL